MKKKTISKQVRQHPLQNSIDCYLKQMPFYRNLGAIRFESQTTHFQIFKAEPDTVIFQSKIQSANLDLQSIAEFYQSHLHNSNIQYYNENNKNPSIVVAQCKPAQMHKVGIDELCRSLLESAKTVSQITLLFPRRVGEFSISQFRITNGKLAFFYLPITEINDEAKIEVQLAKGILSIGTKLKDESNMSHKLLIKKLAKCKNLHQITQEINYFYSVYGVGSKSIKQPFQLKQSRKKQPKRKLNLFKMVTASNSRPLQGKLSGYSNSLHHSSAPRKMNSFSIGIPDKNGKAGKMTSTSCSARSQNRLKFRTINFNSSFHASEQRKILSPKVKKSLKRTKINASEAFNTQINIADEQKLLKKLNKKKTQASLKKLQSISSFKQIQKSVKYQKQPSITSKENSKLIQESPKIITESNPVSIKFPVNTEQSVNLINETRPLPSKTIHKHESIHISNSKIPAAPHPQPQPQYQLPQPPALPLSTAQTSSQSAVQIQQSKKLKKKVYKQEDWGSEIQIIDLAACQKQHPGPFNNKMNETKELNNNKASVQRKSKQIEDATQTRKNSWNPKPPSDEATKVNSKIKTLVEKKDMLDYMGQTVVNTPGYLKNYEKIFWELPLFFIYRAFYIERSKLAREIQVLPEFQNTKELLQENEQIGIAVNKMAKMITKKLKKEDPNVLKSIQVFLNTDEKLNCDAPMKSLLGQYVSSLTDASSDYHELLQHEIEVVNSYLIAKGVKIDLQTKPTTPKEQKDYLKVQLQKLKPYL